MDIATRHVISMASSRKTWITIITLQHDKELAWQTTAQFAPVCKQISQHMFQSHCAVATAKGEAKTICSCPLLFSNGTALLAPVLQQ